MLRISHDFQHNTLGVHGARERSYRTSWCWTTSLLKPCASTMQLQSHCCARRRAHTCRDECLHMCLGLNAALRLVPSRVWCGELRTLHSDVQKGSNAQTRRMGLTAVRGRRVVWWPWIFLPGFCDSAPPSGGSGNYTPAYINSVFKLWGKKREKQESERKREKCTLQGWKETTSHPHNLSRLSPPTLFLLSLIFFGFLLDVKLFPSVITTYYLQFIDVRAFLPFQNESKLHVG